MLKDKYFLVDWKLNGEDGFLVFGGLITGNKELTDNREEDSEKNLTLQKGIII